jgi:uncharacterized membrane protein YfcA
LIDILFVFLGLVLSVLMGLTGMGGGALTTPILIFLGIPPSTAVGSDLAFTSVTRGIGSVLHGKRANVDFGLTKLILLGSLPATVCSYALLPFLKMALGTNGFNSLLTGLLAVILLAASLIGLSRSVLGKSQNREVNTGNEEPQSNNLSRNKKLLIVMTGVVVGFAVQFTSVGSGTILIFILMYLFQSKKIVGTDIFHAFILTSLGALLHFSLGDINADIVLSLALGGIPGMFLGVRIHSLISFVNLRNLLNVVIMGAGLTLIAHAFI